VDVDQLGHSQVIVDGICRIAPIDGLKGLTCSDQVLETGKLPDLVVTLLRHLRLQGKKKGRELSPPPL
jgi:hypothetical protein